MTEVWKTALNQGLSPELHAMHRSIDFDWVLWPYDLSGSRVRMHMLRKVGLISEADFETIQTGLDSLETELKQAVHQPQDRDEDVHGWLERLLCEKVGPIGANLHTGRSRNEQVLLDVKLFLVDQVHQWIQHMHRLTQQLAGLEQAAGETLLPAYTHLQRAQPIFLHQYWAAHRVTWQRRLDQLLAFFQRLRKECPMGAGAINASTLPLDYAFEAKMLGFEHASVSPLATVSLRSEWLEFSGLAVHWMLEVSRLLEDLILWNTREFGFLRFKNTVTTGSSMMPQKRNPDLCELLRGKVSTALGHYNGLLALTKNLPMGYMKDLQEDKPMLFGICAQLDAFFVALPAILDGLELQAETMIQAAGDPSLLATDLMEFLLAKGVPLRQAHHQVAEWVYQASSHPLGLPGVAKAALPDLPEDFFEPIRSCRARLRPQT